MKSGLKSIVFFPEWTFLQNMGMREVIFPLKSEKKDILLTFLIHNINQFWQNWRFLIKYDMGMTAPGFFISNLKKNDMRAQYFWKIGRFFYKYRHKSNVFFLENGRLFDKSWVLEQ